MRVTIDRRWVYVAAGELAGFFVAEYWRFGSFSLAANGGSISPMLFLGYVLVCAASVVVACWCGESRRPARLVLTVIVALAAYAVLGVPLSWFALSWISQATPEQPLIVFTVLAWIFASLCSLGVTWAAIRLVRTATDGTESGAACDAPA